MLHFCNPWKRQKTKGFLTFSGGIEMEHWAKMSYDKNQNKLYLILTSFHEEIFIYTSVEPM